MSTDTTAADAALIDAVLPASAIEELDHALRLLCRNHVAQAVARQQALQPDVRVTPQDVVYIQLKVLREIAPLLERLQGQICIQGAALGLSNAVMGEPLGIGREGVRGLRQRAAERSAQ